MLLHTRDMPNYRRLFVPGGTWFFTVNLHDRSSRLLVERVDILQEAVRQTQQRFRFEIDAMVVLPNHIHAIWTLPPNDTDFPLRWRSIKARFSKALPKQVPLSGTKLRQGERGIWQRRYWEHLIRDERDLSHHIDYCWFNPVKHGFVSRAEEWPHSTFHRDMEGNPSATDFTAFEANLAKHARNGRIAGYGEPD